MEIPYRGLRTLALVYGLLAGVHWGSAQELFVGGDLFRFTVKAETPNAFRYTIIGIGATGGSKVPFQFVGLQSVDCRECADRTPNDFVVVSPSSGVTPAYVTIALNPNVVPFLPPGTITFAVVFAKPGETCPACAGARMALDLNSQGPPSVSSILNAATLQPGPLAPGQIVSIFGEHLGTPPVSSQYDTGGRYPTTLGNSKVLFNGVAASLLYVSTTQINAIVPWGIAGARTVEVVVSRYRFPVNSPPVTAQVSETAPGLFTVTGTGSGQGAFRNNGLSLNGPNNPAPRGSVIEMYGTGAGPWSQLLAPNPVPLSFPDGSIFIAWNARIAPSATPLTVSIGGRPAQVQYSGPAPLHSTGMIQVNAVIPDNVASGPQPVVLTIGPNSNAQQQVTVAVQ